MKNSINSGCLKSKIVQITLVIGLLAIIIGGLIGLETKFINFSALQQESPSTPPIISDDVVANLFREGNNISTGVISPTNLSITWGIKMNDSLEFTSNSFQTTRIKLLKVNHLKSMKPYLIRNMDATAKRIYGRIEGTSQLHAIICDKCEPIEMNDQDYILNIKPNVSPPYEITYISTSGKSIKMSLTPQHEDDLIHIDLAFDDGGMLNEFYRNLKDIWHYIFSSNQH